MHGLHIMKFMPMRFGNINCKQKCSERFNEGVNDKYYLKVKIQSGKDLCVGYTSV